MNLDHISIVYNGTTDNTPNRLSVSLKYFSKMPISASSLGKLLLDLIAEDTWSIDWTVAAVFFVNQHNGCEVDIAKSSLIISSDIVLGRNEYPIKVMGKDSLTVKDVEERIIEECHGRSEVLRKVADSLLRKCESLSTLKHDFENAKHVAQIVKAIGYDDDERHPLGYWRKNTRPLQYVSGLEPPTGEWEGWLIFTSGEFLAFSDLESGRVKVLMTTNALEVLLDIPRNNNGRTTSEALNDLISSIPYAN